MERIHYDGYSSSAVASVIAPDSKVVIGRQWLKNDGSTFTRNIIPNLKRFYLQISPASTDRVENFPPMTVELFVVEQSGKYSPVKLQYNAIYCVGMVLFIVISVILCIIRALVLFHFSLY